MNIIKLNTKIICLFQFFNHETKKLTSYLLILICLININHTRAQDSIKDINTFDKNGKIADHASPELKKIRKKNQTLYFFLNILQ